MASKKYIVSIIIQFDRPKTVDAQVGFTTQGTNLRELEPVSNSSMAHQEPLAKRFVIARMVTEKRQRTCTITRHRTIFAHFAYLRRAKKATSSLSHAQMYFFRTTHLWRL